MTLRTVIVKRVRARTNRLIRQPPSYKMNEDEDIDDTEYRIKNWTPPWIDNGQRLSQLVETLVKMKDDDAWKVATVLLIHQFDEDINRLRDLVQQMREIERLFEE